MIFLWYEVNIFNFDCLEIYSNDKGSLWKNSIQVIKKPIRNEDD